MGIPATYDAIFERQAAGVPSQLLKVTAWQESAFNPKARPPVAKDGKPITSARGLGQIIKANLDLFNKENGYKFTEDDLDDPEKNVMVMAWLFQKIAKTFSAHTTIKQNWDDPAYIGLLEMAYMAGSSYSSNGGIPYIVASMEKSGIPDSRINPTTVRQAAMKGWPAKPIYNDGRGFLSSPEFAKAVDLRVKDYFSIRGKPLERLPWEDAAVASSSTTSPATSSSTSVGHPGGGISRGLKIAGVLAVLAGIGAAAAHARSA